MIKRIIERWDAIKKLLFCDEYFLGVSRKDDRYDNGYGPICYDYINNTNRDLFYVFIHDYIENNLRPISGKFVCTNHFRLYKGHELILDIPKDTIININKGIITKIEGEGIINKNILSLDKIPTKELYAHFTYIN